MKRAIIVGHTGQDGTYLYKNLLQRGYDLIGLSGKSVLSTDQAFNNLIDIKETEHVSRLVDEYKPDEIYYLAAVHHASIDLQPDDGKLFEKSIAINLSALINFLEAIRKHSKPTKLFYAASSHIFGIPESKMQDERTPMQPVCIYGITKTAGVNACQFYRNEHDLFASVGIFYNHESPLRSSKFVSKKIVEGAVAIKKQKKKTLLLGSLTSKIDWGYAEDYVEAAYSILQLRTADNFIISSGKLHTVKDFVEGVFGYLNLDWKKHVIEDPSLITKRRRKNLCGNNSKLVLTGWKPKVNFDQLIRIMVDAEVNKYESK